jgi:hypothetical protein
MRRERGEWELADAFAAARYQLPPTERGITLTFEVPIAPGSTGSRSLDAILPRGVWAILSAANPWSIETSAEENAARMDALAAELAFEGVSGQWMVNAAADGGWEEPSFLVEGLPRERVLGLCWKFGQAAAVLGVGTRCGLLWTRSERWVVMPAKCVAG